MPLLLSACSLSSAGSLGSAGSLNFELPCIATSPRTSASGHPRPVVCTLARPDDTSGAPRSESPVEKKQSNPNSNPRSAPRFSSSEDLSGEENRHRDLVPETQIPDSQRGLDLAFTPPLPPRSRQPVHGSHGSQVYYRLGVQLNVREPFSWPGQNTVASYPVSQSIDHSNASGVYSGG
eukprot:gene29286-12530_t